VADRELARAAVNLNRAHDMSHTRVGFLVMHQPGQIYAVAAAGPNRHLHRVEHQRGFMLVAARQPRMRRE
jgi:hypothetical protein